MANLSPTSKAILKAAQRVLRDKTSVVMTKGGMFDSQFKSLINTALKCEFPDSILKEEMGYLCRQECLDLIVKNDKYGDGTTHFMGDAE
jgi:hypothetical protein